jgi:Na+/H+-dicarboxylate symporter
MFFFKATPLWKQMLWGILLGLTVGLILSPHAGAVVKEETANIIAEWLALPGGVFLALIKMIILPLIIASITLAIADSKNLDALKTKGTWIGLYFVGTTTIAVMIGILLSGLIEPGQYIDPALVLTEEALANRNTMPDFGSDRPNLPSLLLGLLPDNPAKAMVEYSMLQIVIASIITGIALLSLPDSRSKPIIDLLQAALDVAMRIVFWVMKLAPMAVFGFLAHLAVQMGPDTLIAMSAYIGTVIAGLLCMLVLYMVILFFAAHRNPFDFFKKIREAQILAFSTSSSAATMPISLKVAEEKLDISPETAGFIIPLGTTINMDGTAVYQIIAALFLAQVFGVDLTFMQIALLSVTIIGASIGSPGSPGVGLVILSGVLASIGITAGGIAMILAVDRILDMCRTVINVTGDLTAAAVMDKWLQHDRHNSDSPV